MRSRLRNVAAGALLTAAVLAGCGVGGFVGLYDTPLPGGADLGDRPYRVSAQFADVLDLVPQSSVKVNDVAVGRIDRIELVPDNSMVVVEMLVNGAVRLPANATAELRQSSLLGEKYVQLSAPAGEPPQGVLADGAVVPLSRTNRNAEVEEVLGALSLLLNGGGVGQLHDIVTELNKALSGNEAELRDFMANVHTLVTELDGQRENIVRAIDGLNRLAGRLASQTADISNALVNLAPGLQVIEQQRGQLVTMLTSLDRLSTVAVDTVNRTRAGLVADLSALAPVLHKLVEAGDSLPVALEYLVTYPYPSYAVNAVKGDYFNVDAHLDLDFSAMVDNLNSSGQSLLPPPGQAYGEGQSLGPIPLPLPVLPTPKPVAPPPSGPRLPGLDLIASLLGGA